MDYMVMSDMDMLVDMVMVMDDMDKLELKLFSIDAIPTIYNQGYITKNI